jgi:hypothetical protein
MARNEFDSVEAPKTNTVASNQNDHSGWLAKNVLDQYIDGTGAVQVYNTLVSEKIKTSAVDHAPAFSAEWAVQNIASTAGALTSFVVAGKFAGAGLRGIGEELAAKGTAARVLSSEGTAQVVGAGGYEALKDPKSGETRLGNTIGTMAGFVVFAGGNHFIDQNIGLQSGALKMALSATSRVGVGALGGGLSYDANNLTNSLVTGQENQSNWQGRLSAMASGGLMNVALPALQHGADKVIDFAVNSRSYGNGVPVDRYVRNQGIADPEIDSLVYENRLARVRRLTGSDSEVKADIKANAVDLRDHDGAGKLAHELNHLKLAAESEPAYRKIADTLKTDGASVAEQQFYALREKIELSSRQLENRVNNRIETPQAPQVVATSALLPDQIAANGKAYNEVWQEEWSHFEENPSYRPEFEYAPLPFNYPSVEPFLGKPLIEPTKMDALNLRGIPGSDLPFTTLLGGWIAPNGDYFPINYEAGHWNKAMKITGMENDGDTALEKAGWVHLSSQGSTTLDVNKRMTRSQQNKLMDIAALVSDTAFGKNLMSQF